MEYDELLAGTEPFEDRLRGGDDLLGIFYTGGTTGFPKGVMLSHDNILTSVLGTQTTGHWADPHGSTLHVAPLFHLAAAANWASQLTVGGAHVTLPGFDPAQMLAAVEEHRISTALLVPTMIQLVVDHPDATHRNVDSVKTLIYGASPITAALLERAMKVFRHADFVQAYGMTELAPVATVLTPEDHREGRLRSAGRAAAHAEVRIVGPDDEPLAVREVGEVVCRGSHVMQGYWNQPEATAEALRGGWMHTGDLGYLDEEGYLFITDRLKDMIITGGENVYSTEVENALGSHPAVAACAVVGVPDEVWGERVHAVVVLRPGAIATGDVLRAHCRARNADYKAPRSWEFTDALPLSNTGKVLKHVIRAAHWGGANRGVN
jgi:acyl-CoA synthetase (AMP-forming)/AMP-acid ligase II